MRKGRRRGGGGRGGGGGGGGSEYNYLWLWCVVGTTSITVTVDYKSNLLAIRAIVLLSTLLIKFLRGKAKACLF